jgi:hypothetical protein
MDELGALLKFDADGQSVHRGDGQRRHSSAPTLAR